MTKIRTYYNLLSDLKLHRIERRASANSTYPKGGFSCSKDSFVVNGSLVLRMKFSGKNPALRVAANRQVVKKRPFFKFA